MEVVSLCIIQVYYTNCVLYNVGGAGVNKPMTKFFNRLYIIIYTYFFQIIKKKTIVLNPTSKIKLCKIILRFANISNIK